MDILSGDGDEKILPLEINLWDEEKIKNDYVVAKEKYLKENKEFDSNSELVVDRKVNEEKWDKLYEQGWLDWSRSSMNVATLSARGQQLLVDKINEIIEALNILNSRTTEVENELPQIRTVLDNSKNE